ncbi:MAG TPA: helix-turn-helix transcriptional regulator [Polyangiaceae bacterium]|nr:helix-turn-helix transcriptional regulator [Polyangiaceae bacterium]
MSKADPRARNLGQRLQQAADHRGLKQADIVRALGMPPGTISRYFSGTRRVADTARLDEIAALLGVSYEWLSLGRGQPAYDPAWQRPPDVAGPRARSGKAPRGAGGPSVSAAARAPDEGPRVADDPYLERRRALVALRTHLQGDQDRVRDSLLLLHGPPYDTWTRDDWEAEALRERDRLEALDARWRRPAPAGPGPERTPKARKVNS